jgi:hypothetical protein
MNYKYLWNFLEVLELVSTQINFLFGKRFFFLKMNFLNSKNFLLFMEPVIIQVTFFLSKKKFPEEIFDILHSSKFKGI